MSKPFKHDVLNTPRFLALKNARAVTMDRANCINLSWICALAAIGADRLGKHNLTQDLRAASADWRRVSETRK